MNILKMRKGFTLIELLVVIAIIGILAALVLVSLGTSRKRAADVQGKNKVRNMVTSVEQYGVDNSNDYWGHTTPVQSINTTNASGNYVNVAYSGYVTAGASSSIFDKGSAAAYQYISGTGAACTAVATIGATATKYSLGIELQYTGEPASTNTGIYALTTNTATINGCALSGFAGATGNVFGQFGPQ